jgi:hypothetical protein
MAVTFNYTVDQYIKFATPTAALGLTSQTISLWYYLRGANGSYVFVIWDGTGTDADEYNYLSIGGGKITFSVHFSTTDGRWVTTNVVLTTGQWHNIIITYDGSATTKDPIIYINGVSKAITEMVTPVGTYRTGTNTDLYIGGEPGQYSPDGDIKDARRYNVIKTPAQAAVIAAEDIMTDSQIDMAGLVFFAPLWMCKGAGASLDTFIGKELSVANELPDNINGIWGVPAGSPKGAANS